MKQRFTLWLATGMLLFCLNARSQGVGIAPGEITPDLSAILELRTTNQGFLPPRMTATQRNAISNPAIGLMVYDLDSSSIMLYVGGIFPWKPLQLKTPGFMLPFSATVNAPISAFSVNNTSNSGGVISARIITTERNLSAAVSGVSDAAQGTGVYGMASGTFGSGGATGVYGVASDPLGTGVRGYNSAYEADGSGSGVVGVTATAKGSGIIGQADSRTGPTSGVWGLSWSNSGTGVYGYANSNAGVTKGVFGTAASPAGFGGQFTNINGGFALNTQGGKVKLDTLAGTGNRMVIADANGLLGTQPIPAGGAGFNLPYAGTGGAPVNGSTFSITNNTSTGEAIRGEVTAEGARSSTAIMGNNSAVAGVGVQGHAFSSSGITAGVIGTSENNSNGIGVWGLSNAATGVTAGLRGSVVSNSGGIGVVGDGSAESTGYSTGVLGTSLTPFGTGVMGGEYARTGNSTGVLGIVYSPDGKGAEFSNWGGGIALNTTLGKVKFDTLMGSGNRMVIADANGFLGTQAIPTGGAGFTLPYSGSTSGNALDILSTGDGVSVINATSTATTGINHGITAVVSSPDASAVVGNANASTGGASAILGQTNSNNGVGIKGHAFANTGFTTGVFGSANSTTGIGVNGVEYATSGSTIGVQGSVNSPQGSGGLFANGATNGLALSTTSGKVKFLYLGGTSTRMVVADNNGVLSTQDIPTGGSSPDNWGTQVATTNTTLTGDGTAAQPLGIAPQGATTGQVLTYNGTTWAPANATGGSSFSLPYSGSTNTAYGLDITNTSATGTAVKGTATNSSGNAAGLTGISSGNTGNGVRGTATATSGVNYGVAGTTQSYDGAGGYFSNLSGEAGSMALVTGTGKVWINNLAGGGDRMVVADQYGILRTAPIPTGGGSATDKVAFKASAGGVNNGLPRYDAFNKLPGMSITDGVTNGMGYNYGGHLSEDGKAIFTAPVNGVYHFEVHLSFSATDSCKAIYAIRLLKHGSQVQGSRRNGVLDFIHGYDVLEGELVRDISLTAGDTIEAEYMVTTPSLRPAGFNIIGGPAGDISSTFTGHLVTAVD